MSYQSDYFPDGASSTPTSHEDEMLDVDSPANSYAGEPMDYILLAAVMAAVGFGVVMVFSSSTVYAQEIASGNPLYYLKQQTIFAGMGIIALIIGASVHYQWLRRFSIPLLLFSILLMAALMIPGVGITVNRATRWISLGPFRFQPTELAKMALVVYLSASLVRKREKIRTFHLGFLPHFIVCLVMVALCMRQPDFSTSALMMWLMLWVLYVGGTKLAYLVASFILFLPVVYLALTSSNVRIARLMAFRDPWEHRFDIGYHIVNSIIGLGSGGVTGLGLGQSRQKLLYLPEAHTDFILSIVGEELGLLGVMAVTLLFAIIIWRGIRIALRARDNFGTYLAFGLTFLLGMQAAINMAVVTAVLPTTGLTLPFISYGGSSLLISMLMAGMLLNISQRRPDTWAIERKERKRRRGFERAMRRRGEKTVYQPPPPSTHDVFSPLTMGGTGASGGSLQ